MAEPKTTQQKIADLDERMAQLAARKKALLQRESEKERKARTKRLIEVGGAVESVLGRPIEKADLPLLIAFLKTQEERGGYFTKAMERKEVSHGTGD